MIWNDPKNILSYIGRTSDRHNECHFFISDQEIVQNLKNVFFILQNVWGNCTFKRLRCRQCSEFNSSVSLKCDGISGSTLSGRLPKMQLTKEQVRYLFTNLENKKQMSTISRGTGCYQHKVILEWKLQQIKSSHQSFKHGSRCTTTSEDGA